MSARAPQKKKKSPQSASENSPLSRKIQHKKTSSDGLLELAAVAVAGHQINNCDPTSDPKDDLMTTSSTLPKGSNGSSGGTTEQGAPSAPSSDHMRLKIGGDLHPYPFLQKSFEVQVFLIGDDRLKCGEEVPLIMSLQFENQPNESLPSELYTIESGCPVIGMKGLTKVMVRFNDVSMSFGNKKFVLVFSVDPSSNLKDVEPAMSIPMLCVRYRLSLQMDMSESRSAGTAGDVWFKDEGGRENRIDLHVQLLGPDNRPTGDRKVPLKVTLTYGNGQPVIKQDLLTISPECRLVTDDSGAAVLKVRINDVSKNHQRQLFSVLVSADTAQDPLLNDVSPDSSSAIEVKSKRSKRQREDALEDAPGTSNKSTKNNNGNEDYNSDSYAAAGGGGPGGGGSGNGSGGGGGGGSSATAAVVGHSASSNAISRSSSTATIGNPVGNGVASSSSSSSFTRNLPPVNNVGDAIDAVTHWIESIVTSIPVIQWHRVGYDRNPDGSINESQPFYSMNNPNEILTNVIREYNTRVRDSLSMIRDSYDKSQQMISPPIPSLALPHGGNIMYGGVPSPSPFGQQFALPNYNGNGGFQPTFQGGLYDGSGQGALPLPMHMMQMAPVEPQSPGIYYGSRGAMDHEGTMENITSSSSSGGGGNTKKNSRSNNKNSNDGGDDSRRRTSSAGSRNQRQVQFDVNSMSNDELQAKARAGSIDEWQDLVATKAGATHSLESQVYYVLAHQTNLIESPSSSSYSSTRIGDTGVPAFDAYRNLLGFYQEALDANNVTTIEFIPLSRVIVDINLQSALRAQLDNLISQQGDAARDSSGNPLARDVDDNNPRRMDETSLYSLARCHNDLERLKQDAMVHCWMSEMTLLEDDIFSS